MVASIIIIVIGVISKLTIVFTFIIVIRLFVIWLEPSFRRVLALGSKASLSLAHLVKLGIVLVVCIILKDLILLVFQVLILQLLDHFLLFGAPLAILQVVHVQLVLQIVDIRVLFNICAVESLKFSLKAFVLLLELRLDVLDTFEALVSSLQFNTSPLDGVL